MKLSIRYKILFGFLLVLLISYITQIVSYIRTDKFIAEQTGLTLKDKSEVASRELQSFILQVEKEHLGIGELYIKDLADDHEHISDHNLQLIKQDPFFESITILSLSGRELNKVENTGAIPMDQLNFEITTTPFLSAKNGQIGISKVYIDEKKSTPNLDIYSPIKNDTGEIVVIVKSHIQLERLWDLIAQIKLSKEGFAYVVDEGRLIAPPDRSLLLNAPNFSERPIIKKLLAKSELTAEDYRYVSEKGTEVIANGTSIPGLGWVAIAEEPIYEAFSQRNFMRNLFVGTLVGSLILLIIISFILTRQLTLPINILKNAANSLQYGKLDREVQIKSGDEIEALGTSFNAMATKLKTAFADLESKIELLEKQKVRLDQSAKLLLRRDLDLREINNELENEKELAEAERNKFSIVLAGISDAVIAVDTNQNIVIFNQAAEKITGLRANNVIGGPLSKALQLFEGKSEVAASVYSPMLKTSYEGITFKKEGLKLNSTLGKTAYVNLISGQIKEGSAVNLGAITTFHDVTSEKDLERMKLDFVSMAAHELRTPLTTIQGYISFLQDENTLKKLTADEREFLDRAQTSAIRLTQLIENLLVVSHIEKGTMAIKPQPIQIESLFDKLCTEMMPLAKTKGLKLLCEAPENPLPQVLADTMRIGEVITNLVGNAINYTQSGSIIVSFYKDKDDIVSSIADTGPGIPSEAIPHLFTKFFRIQGMLQSGSKGTGLGLYISKNIVEAHHGKIWVQSDGKHGSTFYFSLPIAKKS